jgi:hypothetical protein
MTVSQFMLRNARAQGSHRRYYSDASANLQAREEKARRSLETPGRIHIIFGPRKVYSSHFSDILSKRPSAMAQVQFRRIGLSLKTSLPDSQEKPTIIFPGKYHLFFPLFVIPGPKKSGKEFAGRYCFNSGLSV